MVDELAELKALAGKCAAASTLSLSDESLVDCLDAIHQVAQAVAVAQLPRWCHGHHVKAWVDGGPTTLDNSVLLCGYHHRLVHRGHWTVRLAADGLPEFIPPTYVDPQQRPRRNTYHFRT